MSLGRLLQGRDGVRLEAQVRFEVLGHLAHREELRRLADLTERSRPRFP